MTTVLLADDHAAIRAGLRMMLQGTDDLEVIGEAEDGDAAVSAARALRPDVILMDVRMPGSDGIAATARIVAEGLGSVVVLTTFDLDEYVFGALRTGAAGFLVKTAPAETIVSAVRAVARGDAALSPTVTRRVIDALRSEPVAPEHLSADTQSGGVDLAELTGREREVLRCLGDGLSNAQIGAELYITEATVKTHVSRVFMKLGVTSRVQAAIQFHGG